MNAESASLPTFLGMQLENSLTVANGWTWSPYGRLAWVHEFLPDRDITASFITVAG